MVLWRQTTCYIVIPQPSNACQHSQVAFLPTTMSFVTRNPRYVFLLFVTLLVCAFFLLPSHASSFARYTSSPRTTKQVLREEDARYDQALEAREELVRKWGPTAEDVVPYVSAPSW